MENAHNDSPLDQRQQADETHSICPRSGGAVRDIRNKLSKGSRAHMTANHPKTYVKAGKADKGRIEDQVVGVTGWCWNKARRRPVAAARLTPSSGGAT